MTPVKRVTTRRLRVVQVVDVVSVFFLLAAALLIVWPVDTSEASAPNAMADNSVSGAGIPLLPPMAGLSEGNTTDSLMAAIVRGNPFSSSRRAPTIRFTPPGITRGDIPMASVPYELTTAADMSTAPGDGFAVPHLSGIVVQDGIRMALIQFTSGESGPTLYREGDRRAGFRVDRIGVSQVTIISANGTRTLRLAPRAAKPPTSPSVSPSMPPSL